jgi:carbamoyl-phosphate synthase/aspartate carbamoyltransferase/dihydroorotase
MSRILRIPGMVDPHTHLRGLDWSHKGTFASETAAAAAGGYWAIFDMPNTQPPTLDRAALDRKLAEIGAQAVCDWGVYFGASAAGNWDEYPSVEREVCGLKMFCNDTTGHLLIEDQSVRDQHFAAWPRHKIVSVHAEEDTILDVLKLVRQYRQPTHFLHISTAREIDYLTAAKNEGLPVTVGVCPHHLWLTEDDLRALGPLGLMKPGLKTARDRDALWEAIDQDVVDVVESDHAPHTLPEKQSESPPFGVPGLETTLPLLLTAAYEGRLTIERVIDLVAEAPRRIWGLKCPSETYTVVDLDAEAIITGVRLHTQCGWSPFEGMRVHGRVIETWIRGDQVYDGERVLAEAGSGRNLYG